MSILLLLYYYDYIYIDYELHAFIIDLLRSQFIELKLTHTHTPHILTNSHCRTNTQTHVDIWPSEHVIFNAIKRWSNLISSIVFVFNHLLLSESIRICHWKWTHKLKIQQKKWKNFIGHLDIEEKRERERTCYGSEQGNQKRKENQCEWKANKYLYLARDYKTKLN